MKKLTAVSLFSGCGGFDLGAKQAGVKIIWANDCDAYAAAAYKSILPNVPFHEGDIREVKEFPKADILIGCYPCTGFSQAAKRRAAGRSVRRNLRTNPGNYLYREFLRALRQVKPQFLFVENVPGMLTAADGWFLKRQLAGFRRHGFKVKAKLILAADYGVAQTRKRVFLVGVHKSVKDFVYEFPQPLYGPGSSKPWKTLRDVLGTFERRSDDAYCRKEFHGHYLTRPRKRAWDEVGFTIVAHASHVPLYPRGKATRWLGKDRHGLQGKFNRRFSWRECAKLQCLPDGLRINGGLVAKYRVVGNAVPPPVAKALIKPVATRRIAA